MKDKIIEEMAKIICRTVNGKELKHCEVQCDIDCIGIAKELVNENYRKINENEVVISKEEKQKLLKEMYEQGKFDAIADLEKDYKVVISKGTLERLFTEEEVAKLKEYASKETAEKILKWLTSRRHLFNRMHEVGSGKPRTSYLVLNDEIEELAKEFGVDLGEDK